MTNRLALNRLQQRITNGHQALAAGDIKTASNLARRALEEAPKLVPGHFLVGLIALTRRDHRTAVAALKTVVSLDNEHAAGWAQLARAFVMGGMEDNALTALGKAIALRPSEAAVLDVIGTVYSLLEDQPSAHDYYQRALAAYDAPPLRLNRAKTAVFLGDTAQAREDLEAVLASHPTQGEALWMLSRLERVTDSALVDRIRTALGVQQSDQARAYLYYALGKALEDLEDWSAAFEAYSAGAAAKRQLLAYDGAADAVFFDALMQQGYSDATPGFGDSPARPIFVLGQPRTGTTLVEQLIAASGTVTAAGELPYMPRLIKAASGVAAQGPGNAAVANGIGRIDRRRLGQSYLAAAKRRSGGAVRFTDKLPANFHYAALIAEALPQAQIVHVRRGAMDSVFASFKQLFADAYPHSYNLDEQAAHWLCYHRLMQRYQGIMGDDQLITIDYDHLVGDLEAGSKRLYAHLGLDWSPDVLAMHRRQSAVTTASAAQVREKVHSRSVGRWRRFSPHLAGVEKYFLDQGLDWTIMDPTA